MQAQTMMARQMARLNQLAADRSRLGKAMAAAIAVSCVAAPGFALAGDLADQGNAQSDHADRKLDKQILTAERAVAKQPQNLELRSRLAQVYLAAGRFLSASGAFEDAVALGDKTPASALGMALSYIGSSRNQEALALLGQWRDAIPVGDFGLALALAGQPAQAVAILSEAVKAGDNTPKNRQNLAYAFALDGHLAEARVVASQDVPVDQLEARVSDWALQASVGSAQSRVAALLGAPVRSDPGQPTQLALAGTGNAPALAMVEAAPAPVSTAQELPPAPADAPALAFAEPAPVADPVTEPAEPAVASAEPVQPATALAAATDRQFVSNPVVQAVAESMASTAPVRLARAETVRPTPPVVRKPVPAPRRPAATASTHVVQLGSFSTEAGAHRAWKIFQQRDPGLKERELHLTQAVVNGRTYWRVAAGGFDMASAKAKCSSGRVAAGSCIAHSAARELPGAVASVSRRLASR